MATVTSKLTVSSTDLLSDSLSISQSDSWTSVTQGGIQLEKITGTTGSPQTLYVHGDWYVLSGSAEAAVKLYFMNKDTTSTDYIYIRIGAVDVAKLRGGEFCWIPWDTSSSGAADIKVWATTSGTLLEHGAFTPAAG
jgi:hypothetical protein